MIIHIVVGGPAGLYLALLMKKQDVRHKVRVVEQNPNRTQETQEVKLPVQRTSPVSRR